MGSPQAGKLFLQALTGSGLESSSLQQHSMFDTVALQTIKDIEASEGQVTCLIPVEERVQNRYGTLHGGCIGLNLCPMTACSPRMQTGTCQKVSAVPGFVPGWFCMSSAPSTQLTCRHSVSTHREARI